MDQLYNHDIYKILITVQKQAHKIVLKVIDKN
jgi:hypothetical protein